MIKRRRPRTESCNAAKTGMERGETTFAFHMERTRGQIRFEPTSQGQCQLFQTTRKDETIRCYGSIVSNAAERSRRQRHDIFESLWH